jgi:hypothetical protein
MVEAFIHESQADDLDAQQLGDQRVRIELGTKTVSGPEQGSHAVEKRVSGTFERQVLGQLMHAESVFLEPFTKMWLFGLAFPVQESTQNGTIAQDQACVRGKDHVWRSREWSDQFDFSLTGQEEMESAPLFGGQGSVGAVDVAFHPGIDDIVDLKKLRWTH